MVIIKTSAVDVSIHAVSPELILSVPTRVGSVGPAGAAAASAAAGAAAASAADAAEAGVSSAHEGLTENNNSPITANRNILVINANPLTLLDCICATLIRADAHDLVEIEHKDL